ncbi:hypothetical protein B0H14DRAFT_3476063 [Mycena olivaceomarginata]|nr:hypothetical protein B0H14DRAFT_3476063 [Mycena olivaceomarginata]
MSADRGGLCPPSDQSRSAATPLAHPGPRRGLNAVNVGNREFLDAPAESRGRSTAPTQRHAALLKSADPMVAATRCPGGRAKTFEDCAKREKLEGHTQSCDYRFGPGVAAVKDRNVAGAYTSGTGHGISKSAPRIAGTVKGATTAKALFVPADPDAHGPSLGWLPDVFRVASLGSIGTVGTEAVQTSLSAALPALLFALVFCALVSVWICEFWKTPALYGRIPRTIFSVNGSALVSLTVSRRLRLMNVWDKIRPRNCISDEVQIVLLVPQELYDGQILDRIAQDYARSTATDSRRNETSNGGGFNAGLPNSRASGELRNDQARQPPMSRSDGARTKNGQNAAHNQADARNSFVKVMYWNIYHNFTLKLTDPEFHSLLREYDIMFFAETDMLPGEEDAADVPAGYTLLSLPRKPLLNNSRRGGGIALIIRDTFKFTKSKLSSPDILVLDMGSIWLIGAYIPPGTSRWEGWTDVEPLQKLWETVALCTRSDDKPVASLADINARTGSLQSSSRGVEWLEALEEGLGPPGCEN